MILAWANGRFLPPGEVPRVSILDRGYLLGDSLFETLRARGGKAIAWDLHLDRFEAAAAALAVSLPHARDELLAAGHELVQRSRWPDVTVRLTASRGEGGRGISPAGCEAPFVTLLARPTTPYAASCYAVGIDSMIVSPRRIPNTSLDARLKTGNYLPAILGKIELDAAGLVEGVMLTVDGAISSGCVSNVFFVIDGALVTPDQGSDCREGVTRERVLELAPTLGIGCRIERIEPAQLAQATEMFFTNTVMDCLPVRRLGAQHFGPPGPLTRALHATLGLP